MPTKALAIPLTLTFEKAGDITTTAHVGSIAAMDDPETHANGG
jgi:copper(I)-binding protein